MNKYRELLSLKHGKLMELETDSCSVAICPDLGGRVFAEVCGYPVHRLDLDIVAHPNKPFNNFGGLIFWPAPEGGRFGFNYTGDKWYVQPAINDQPFEIVDSGSIKKHATLTNRAGTKIETLMTRRVSLSSLPDVLASYDLRGWLSYTVSDAIEVANRISLDAGLIAAWTLEQFDATENTIAFCGVERPEEAINFDYYEHPGDRITYFERGFTYNTDGRCPGQIGIKKSAGAAFIGFYDRTRLLVCIRQIVSPLEGMYFNIADNEQPDGLFSASDVYSIFNSGPDLQTFELETVGGANIDDGLLLGSKLLSRTTFAVFQNKDGLDQFVNSAIGCEVG
ncbi:MAG: hypothetical protein M1133_07825 [Armatimonadetes bacterium]|nr:hypothetical protein [Armatimonadota bacterium]